MTQLYFGCLRSFTGKFLMHGIFPPIKWNYLVQPQRSRRPGCPRCSETTEGSAGPMAKSGHLLACRPDPPAFKLTDPRLPILFPDLSVHMRYNPSRVRHTPLFLAADATSRFRNVQSGSPKTCLCLPLLSIRIHSIEPEQSPGFRKLLIRMLSAMMKS